MNGWFKWLGWVSLAASFVAIGWNNHSWVMLAIGCISIIFVYMSLIKCISCGIGNWCRDHNIHRYIVYFVAMLIGISLPTVIVMFLVYSVVTFVNA